MSHSCRINRFRVFTSVSSHLMGWQSEHTLTHHTTKHQRSWNNIMMVEIKDRHTEEQKRLNTIYKCSRREWLQPIICHHTPITLWTLSVHIIKFFNVLGICNEHTVICVMNEKDRWEREASEKILNKLRWPKTKQCIHTQRKMDKNRRNNKEQKNQPNITW